jgi:hypothetical protein
VLEKIWRDPVWATVIGAGITAAVGAAWTYFANLWPRIGRWGSSAWEFTYANTALPNWLIALLCLLALPTVLFFLALCWEHFRPGVDSAPSWTSYTKDKFFGLVWRWKYLNGRIERLTTYCPHCDYQVFASDANSFHSLSRIEYNCDSCHSHLGVFNDPLEIQQSKVERFIQQKIRNGSWQGSDS